MSATNEESADGGDWWCAELTDPEYVPGKNVVRLASRALALVGDVSAVAVASVDAIGAEVHRISPGHNSVAVLAVQEFLTRVLYVDQFVWGDFFFCSDMHAAQTISASDPFVSSVQRSVFAIRVADNEYLYLYARQRAVIDAALEEFPHGIVRTGTMADRPFPH